MGTVTYPETFEANLLVDHFGKSSQFKWVANKDVKEAELQLTSGHVFSLCVLINLN